MAIRHYIYSMFQVSTIWKINLDNKNYLKIWELGKDAEKKKTGKFGLLPLVFFSFGTLPLLQFVPEAFSTILNDQKHLYKNLLHKFIKRGEGGQRPFINFIKKTEEMVRGAFP